MTNTPHLIALQQPSEAELQAAIATLQSGREMSGEEVLEATLPVIGEACALYETGTSREDVVAALVARGVEAGSAQVMTDKAVEIVESNRQQGPQLAAQRRTANLQFIAVVLFMGGLLAVSLYQVIRALTT
ncbi:hypothetical protein [Deinococcus enclensis]|uniref:Uncharacterized protein n=1 Tax=Deinococcus enclensis TaxID=1049582 RepID=A0ABT9MIX1_9DEIO|nr:hypothetical protein [Deinococcus enclensis]MDP9766521.1 hypothetical protein [Deinococcus enclensis]